MGVEKTRNQYYVADGAGCDAIVVELSRAWVNRLSQVAYWATPPLLCLVIYWPGLKAWFQQDDFAWLQLRLEIGGWRDFLRLLVEPRAQGTIRPLSERLFFIIFSSLFGLDALPFRIWVFLTQFANLTLLSALTWRLTGLRMAGWMAAVLWISGSGLAKVMSWTSAYNQALCAFFLLGAFYCLVRYVEAGESRYWRWQWAYYLLGFGANEWMIVYPALASLYVLLSAKTYLRKALSLWAPALAYALWHHWMAPPAAAGVYGFYLDGRLLATLLTYWQWAVTAVYGGKGLWPLTLIITAGLAGFVAHRWIKADRLPAFLGAWFVVVIAPVLPLREHLTEYYLTLPTLGLAMLGGYAVALAWRRRWGWRAVSLGLAGAYLTTTLPAAHAATVWNYRQSRMVRGMVRGVARANRLHPGKIILLVGVSSDLFWTGVFDKPFRLVGSNPVFLAPGSEQDIEAHPEYGDVERFILPPVLALRALDEGKLVVYAVEPDRLRNITRVYEPVARARWRVEEPRQVNVAEPIYARQLGPGWYPIQGSHRWTARRATVRLGGPRHGGEKLYIEGYCPAERLKKGPVRMKVSVEGLPVGEVLVDGADRFFHHQFALPEGLVGRDSIEITIEVDRTMRVPGEHRELGLVFGWFAIR